MITNLYAQFVAGSRRERAARGGSGGAEAESAGLQAGGQGEDEQAEAGAEEELAGAGEEAGAGGGDGGGSGQVEGDASSHAATRKNPVPSKIIKMLPSFFISCYASFYC